MVLNGRNSKFHAVKKKMIETWRNKQRRNILLFLLAAYILCWAVQTTIRELIAVQNQRAQYLSTVSEQATWASEWLLHCSDDQKARNAYQMSGDTANANSMHLLQIRTFCKMTTQHSGCDEYTDAAMSTLRKRMDSMGNHRALAKKLRAKHTYGFENIRAQQSYDNRTIMRLDIVEKFEGRPSQGGSNFKIMVHDQHIRAVCSTIDNFNGTYNVNCSFPNYCSVLNVTLMFTNFSAFWGRDLVPLNEPLFIKTICPTINGIATNEIPKGLPSSYCRPQDLKMEDTHLAYWINYNGEGTIPPRWQLAHRGCIVKHVLGQHIQKLIDRYQKVVIAGDSHMRFMLDYILYMTGILPADAEIKLKHFHSKALTYYWARWETDIINLLKGFVEGSVLEEAKANSENLLILSCGAWIQRRDTFTEYFIQLRQLLPALKEFKQTPVGKTTKIVWFTSPPVRESERPTGSDHRNTFATNGVTAWLIPQLREIGVEVFDVTPIIYPKTDTTVCAGHYSCLENGKATPHKMGKYVVDKPYVSGLVGGAVVDYFVQAMIGNSL